jgi:hypothetical protein
LKSVPQVSLVELDPMLLQQRKEFLLEGHCAMIADQSHADIQPSLRDSIHTDSFPAVNCRASSLVLLENRSGLLVWSPEKSRTFYWTEV